MTCVRFLVYDGTGRIVRLGACQPDMLGKQAGNGEYAMLATDGATADAHCVVNGMLREKLDIGREWGAAKVSVGDEVAISGFPAKAHIMITGAANTTADVEAGEPVRLAFDMPGTYRVEVDCGPRYFPKTTIIQVEAR